MFFKVANRLGLERSVVAGQLGIESHSTEFRRCCEDSDSAIGCKAGGLPNPFLFGDGLGQIGSLEMESRDDRTSISDPDKGGGMAGNKSITLVKGCSATSRINETNF